MGSLPEAEEWASPFATASPSGRRSLPGEPPAAPNGKPRDRSGSTERRHPSTPGSCRYRPNAFPLNEIIELRLSEFRVDDFHLMQSHRAALGQLRSRTHRQASTSGLRRHGAHQSHRRSIEYRDRRSQRGTVRTSGIQRVPDVRCLGLQPPTNAVDMKWAAVGEQPHGANHWRLQGGRTIPGGAGACDGAQHVPEATCHPVQLPAASDQTSRTSRAAGSSHLPVHLCPSDRAPAVGWDPAAGHPAHERHPRPPVVGRHRHRGTGTGAGRESDTRRSIDVRAPRLGTRSCAAHLGTRRDRSPGKGASDPRCLGTGVGEPCGWAEPRSARVGAAARRIGVRSNGGAVGRRAQARTCRCRSRLSRRPNPLRARTFERTATWGTRRWPARRRWSCPAGASAPHGFVWPARALASTRIRWP